MPESKKELSDMIHRALTYGIKLKTMSNEETKEYLLNLSDFINKGGAFVSVCHDNRLTIETKYMDPIVMVRIRKGTLEFLPLAENNFFDSFVSVLEYISTKKREEDLMKEFKIFIDEVDKEFLEDEEIEDSIDQTEDDFDWV